MATVPRAVTFAQLPPNPLQHKPRASGCTFSVPEIAVGRRTFLHRRDSLSPRSSRPRTRQAAWYRIPTRSVPSIMSRSHGLTAEDAVG
jgi:hypothetical protein